MVAGCTSTPEAVLAEVVVVTALAFIAQAGEGITTTRLARHGVID